MFYYLVVDVTANGSKLFLELEKAEEFFKTCSEKNHEVMMIQLSPSHEYSHVFNHVVEV